MKTCQCSRVGAVLTGTSNVKSLVVGSSGQIANPNFYESHSSQTTWWAGGDGTGGVAGSATEGESCGREAYRCVHPRRALQVSAAVCAGAGRCGRRQRRGRQRDDGEERRSRGLDRADGIVR